MLSMQQHFFLGVRAVMNFHTIAAATWHLSVNAWSCVSGTGNSLIAKPLTGLSRVVAGFPLSLGPWSDQYFD